MSDIFLSASVPGPNDSPFSQTADPLRIHAAVRALCLVVLRSGRLVWGGHPAITPMVSAACENMGEVYRDRVCLYQSLYFEKDQRPKENDGFSDVRYTAALDDLLSSLQLMRVTMMSEHRFVCGVFIGGKQGILDEFHMFREMQPDANVIILPSTGGASIVLGQNFPELSAPGGDFVGYMRYLAMSLDEEKRPRIVETESTLDRRNQASDLDQNQGRQLDLGQQGVDEGPSEL